MAKQMKALKDIPRDDYELSERRKKALIEQIRELRIRDQKGELFTAEGRRLAGLERNLRSFLRRENPKMKQVELAQLFETLADPNVPLGFEGGLSPQDSQRLQDVARDLSRLPRDSERLQAKTEAVVASIAKDLEKPVSTIRRLVKALVDKMRG